MKQIRITTKNLDYPTDNDCFISEDDPIHEIKKSTMLGGLGSGPIMSAETAELVKKYFNKGEDMAMPKK
jgi:hypothetical protein